MKKFFNKPWPWPVRMAIGAVVGGVVGYMMYAFIGCRTGTCPLTGNPYLSVIIWGGLGAMVAGKP